MGGEFEMTYEEQNTDVDTLDGLGKVLPGVLGFSGSTAIHKYQPTL